MSNNLMMAEGFTILWGGGKKSALPHTLRCPNSTLTITIFGYLYNNNIGFRIISISLDTSLVDTAHMISLHISHPLTGCFTLQDINICL